MKSSRNVARFGFIFIFLVTLLFTLEACFLPGVTPSFTIRVHNQTDETLKIFFGDAPIGEAVPGGVMEFKEPAIFSKYVVVAKDMDGNTIHTANFTDHDIVVKKLMTCISHH